MDTIDLYAFVLNRTKELRANAARSFKEAGMLLNISPMKVGKYVS